MLENCDSGGIDEYLMNENINFSLLFFCQTVCQGDKKGRNKRQHKTDDADGNRWKCFFIPEFSCHFNQIRIQFL